MSGVLRTNICSKQRGNNMDEKMGTTGQLNTKEIHTQLTMGVFLDLNFRDFLPVDKGFITHRWKKKITYIIDFIMGISYS